MSGLKVIKTHYACVIRGRGEERVRKGGRESRVRGRREGEREKEK